MKALVYDFSVPSYLATKFYYRLWRKGFYPSLSLKQNLQKKNVPGPSWLLLKSRLSGICGSDQNLLRAQESFSMEPYGSFPCVLGHENYAEVAEMGDNIKDLQVGQSVVVNPCMTCFVHEGSVCEMCRTGNTNLCEEFSQNRKLGPGLSLGYHKYTYGGWGEFFIAHRSQVHPFSGSSSLGILVDPMACVLQALGSRTQGQSSQQTVIIYGLGTLGLLLIAAIRCLELPWKIIAIGRHDFQLQKAREMEADECLRSGKDLLERLSQIVKGRLLPISIGKPVLEGGADTVFDCIGSSDTVDTSLRMVRTQGHVVLLGTSAQLNKIDAAPLWFREVKLYGSNMSGLITDFTDGSQIESYKLAIRMIDSLSATWRSRLESLVTHKFSIDDYAKALNTSFSKSANSSIKVAFEFADGIN